MESISRSIYEYMKLVFHEEEENLYRMIVFIFFPEIISAHEGSNYSFFPNRLHARSMGDNRSIWRRRDEYRSTDRNPFGPIDIFYHDKKHL